MLCALPCVGARACCQASRAKCPKRRSGDSALPGLVQGPAKLSSLRLFVPLSSRRRRRCGLVRARRSRRAHALKRLDHDATFQDAVLDAEHHPCSPTMPRRHDVLRAMAFVEKICRPPHRCVYDVLGAGRPGWNGRHPASALPCEGARAGRAGKSSGQHTCIHTCTYIHTYTHTCIHTYIGMHA